MKTSSEFSTVQHVVNSVQGHHTTGTSQTRVQKFDRTQRFGKQLSLGQTSYNQKASVISAKQIVRHSENAHVPKAKTITTVQGSRGSSIPKLVSKDKVREFGREIVQNHGASTMQMVSPQTGHIMQGKLKPNVSTELKTSDSSMRLMYAVYQALQAKVSQKILMNDELNFSFRVQQVIKKNMLTFRVNNTSSATNLSEKPIA